MRARATLTLTVVGLPATDIGLARG